MNIKQAVQIAVRKMAGLSTNLAMDVGDPNLGRIVGMGNVSSSGKAVNITNAMRLSAMWCCQRIIAETGGSVPWELYREDPVTKRKVKADDHHLHPLFDSSPNANMTDVEFKEAKLFNLAANGNAYSYRDTRSNGETISLTPLETNNVQPKQDSDGEVWYSVNDRGRWERMPQEKIWHVKGFGSNGLVGLSPIAHAREVLGSAMSQEEFGAMFFKQGGMPSGFVTVDKFFKDKDQRDIARENLNQLAGGVGNAHKFALMEGGMKPEPWKGTSPEDMQFILSRQFSIQEICRFFRIPPHMVADLERATFSNIEHLSQEFITFTLLPYFVRLEASVKKWLLKPEERRYYYLRFNVEGFLRGDSAARADYLNKMARAGFITRNEGRSKENFERSDQPGMDEFTVEANLMPIDLLRDNAEHIAKKPSNSGGAVPQA